MVAPVARLIPPSLHGDALLVGDDGLTIRVVAEETDVHCPVCGGPAARVHRRATRTLADLPWAGVTVRLQVRIRKVFGENPACPRRIFRERRAGIAAVAARRTDRQRAALRDLAVARGGAAGARMAARRGMRLSPDTRLRLIRAAPAAARPTPAGLGVDDGAIPTGLTSGTIRIDRERHRPVDVLPDRSRASLAAWLKAHPGVAVIARDRGGASAAGARDGAPDAVPVADRWRLGDTLADVWENVFRGKGAGLQAAATTLGEHARVAAAERTGAAAPSSSASHEVSQGKRRHPRPERWRERAAVAAAAGVARRQATDDQAQTLPAKGASVAQSARTVGIARRTVSRSLREGPPQRKRHRVHGRQRVLAPDEPSLRKRWHEGCRMATVRWREIRAQGVASSLTTVQRFVAQLRREGPPLTARPRTALTTAHGPPPRLVAALVLRRPERRTAEQRTYRHLLRAEDAAIATAVDLAEDFLVMRRRREGARLPDWLAAAEARGVDALPRFAGKLRVDQDAVQAGLTLRWSNGQTEGHVTKLKLIKRQGYGRAKVDVLRQRVLLAA